MSGPNVTGLAETARILNVSKERIRQLRANPDFPTATELECGPIWDAAEIRAYHHDRGKPGRDRNRNRTAALRIYRDTHNISETARRVGVSPSTIRNWLNDLGEPLPRSTP